MTWGTRRQLMIIVILLAAALAVLGVFYVSVLRPVPSCTDGTQNQGERGPDCGGPCATVCADEAADLIVFWTRQFKVSDGMYDVAASLENPNPTFGIRVLPYLFKVYDRNNVLIAERRGNTFVNSRERFVIVESRIATGERIPARATLELGSFTWTRVVAQSEVSSVAVGNKVAGEESGEPRLRAEISNVSSFDVGSMEVVAVVSDERGNALGVNATIVDGLRKKESKSILFTWPRPFDGTPVAYDVFPRVNVISTQ